MADARKGLLGFLEGLHLPGARPDEHARWRHEPIEGGGGITAGDVVDQLEKAPGLENAPTASLRALLRGARRLDPIPPALFEWRERPRDAFYVVMSGHIEYTRDGSPPWTQAARFTVGSRELISGAPMDARVSVAGQDRHTAPLPPPPPGLPLPPPPPPLPQAAPPLVVRISGETFRERLGKDIELQIAVLRNTTTQPGPELAPSPRTSNVYVLSAGSQRVSALLHLPPSADDARLLSGLADLVAETIAEHMFDAVVVIHVVPAGAARPQDTVVRHVWAREGAALRPIVEREAAMMPGVRMDAPADLARDAPLGDGRLGAAPMRVPLGSGVLGIHPVRGHLGMPRATVVEHRSRELPEAGLDQLVTDELGPSGAGDPRVFVVDPGAAAPTLLRCARNVVHLIGSPGDALEMEARGDGLVVIPSAVLPVDPLVPVGGDTPWPTGTVRLRFGPTFGARLDDPGRREPVSLTALGLPQAELDEAAETLRRWARAVTGRRVGLALGGGGPYGFVHAPFIHQLRAAGVPIDLVSGSSMGAVIGAYFTAFDGIEVFEEHRFRLLKRLLKLSFFGSGRDFQEVLDQDLQSRTLLDLEVPFFPVVTDARTGVEWSIRSGSLGRGARASGSMPPFFPTTYIADRRFLDGGLVANVPSRVLRDEGSALIIASNPIANVERGSRAEPIFRARETGTLFLMRAVDTIRLIPMLFGALGDNQSRDAHVVFRPTQAGTESRLMGLRPIDLAGVLVADNPLVPERFARRIEELARVDTDAAMSLNLNRAVNQAKDAWRRLLRNAPGRAWIDPQQRTIEVEDGYAIMFQEGSEQLDASSQEVLRDVAELLMAPDVAGITVRVSASSADLGLRRAEQVRRALAGDGVDVKDDRVKVVGAEGDESVTLPGLTLRTADDLDRLRQALDQANRRAGAGKLRAAAHAATEGGDPDLARLLAIEASALDRGVETDAVLREALLLRGRLARRIEGVAAGGVMPGALCLAWHPDPQAGLLAVGDAHGRVRIVSTKTGAEVTAERLHRAQRAGEHEATTNVRALAWSPDGSLLASVGDDGRILVHARGADPAAAPRLACEADAGTWLQFGVAFSPQGDRLLATCPPPVGAARGVTASACVGIWTVGASALTLGPVLQHDALVRCAAWDPDGELVAVGQESGVVTLWSVASAAPGAAVEQRARFRAGSRFAAALVWFRDPCDPRRGRRLAVAREADATVYSVDGEEAPVSLSGHTAALSTIDVSQSGELLVTAAADHTARIWDAHTGALHMVVRWKTSPLAGAAWRKVPGPVGPLLTWSECGKAQLWNPFSGELLTILTEQRATIHAAAFSPDGLAMATGSADGSTCVWRPVDPVPVYAPSGMAGTRVAAPINTVTWGRRGADEVIVAAFDGTAKVWLPDAAGPAAGLLEAPAPPAGDVPIGSPIASAAVSPDGRFVALTQRPDRSPYLVDLADPKATRRLGPAPAAELPEHPAWDLSYPVCWSADGRRVAVNYGRSAALWDASTGDRLLTLVGPAEDPASIDDGCFRWVAWHPTDSRRFAVARWFHGRSVELWTLGEEAPLRCGDATTGCPWQVAWSPDGACVAAAHHDGTARIYDAATGAVLHTLAHEHPVAVLAWRPDGNALATGELDGIARVWERRAASAGQAETYTLASERTAPSGDVRVVLWSADGRKLLSCGDGAGADVWRAEDAGGVVTWRVGARLQGHRASIGAASFDPTGERAATGSDDGTVRVEPVAFDRLVASVAAHLGRASLDEAEWKQYLGWAGERRATWPRPGGRG